MEGKDAVVENENGACATSRAGSPSMSMRAGVIEDGDFLSPNPQMRAYRSRCKTVRPNAPAMNTRVGVAS